MDKLNFSMVSYDEMKKADKRGYSTLYFYWLENGKPTSFDLPLFINENGNGVLSVEVFKRVFWAFQFKVGFHCEATIKSGKADDDTNYNVVSISVSDTKINELNFANMENYTEPKKADVKRESSAKTKAKSEAKKEAKAIEESKKADALESEWNVKAVKELSKYLVNRFKVKNSELNTIENDILKILENIR